MTSLELDIKYNRVINEVEKDCKELLEEKEQFLILKVREYWNAVRKFNDKTRSLVQELQKQSFPGSQVQAKYEEIYHYFRDTAVARGRRVRLLAVSLYGRYQCS